MTCDPEKSIIKIEDKWLEVLFPRCKQNFSASHLPSHDETHHFRVWQYAKHIVKELLDQGVSVSEENLEQLIVSVFFHDQGMSQTLSNEHGRISRQLCEIFFATSDLQPPEDLPKVLSVIEKHDNKDYIGLSGQNGFELQRILNIADDLDAFGIIGVYRYMEIYLLRDVSMNELPGLVLTNLENRFRHFSESFGPGSKIVTSQLPRYQAIKTYYNDLQKELKTNTNISYGPVGVLQYIKSGIIEQKRPLPEFCNQIISDNRDQYCQQFFSKLLKEYSVI